MAVRFSADGQDYNRSVNLGTLTAYTITCWGKLAVDRNTYSTLWNLDNGINDCEVLQTSSDGTTMGIYADVSPATDIVAMTVGVWYFFAVSRSGTGGTAYYRVGTQPGLTSVALSGLSANVNAVNLIIGESVFATEWLNGCIADLKIWAGAALSTAEIAKEAAQVTPARTANLAGFYPLSRPDPLDYSGNGRALGAGTGATYEDGPPIPDRIIVVRPYLFGQPAAGGTTYPISIAGSVTPAGGMVRQTNHLASGSVTPSGALVKRTQRTLTGATTPSGLLLKQLARALTGSVTPAGAVATIRTRLLAIAGSIAPAGVLQRQTNKLAAGSTTPTGSITKQTSKRPSGTVTPTGAVSTIRTRLLALAGAITPTGLLVRQPGKATAGSTSPSGALTRSLARRLTGAVTPTGALSTTRTRLLAVAGAIAPVGAVVKQAGRMLAGSTTPAGTVAKRVGRGLAGGISPAGVVLKLVGRLFAGGIAPAGGVATDTNIAPTVTPPERTLTVAAETRVLVVPDENRTIAIPAENRTLEA